MDCRFYSLELKGAEFTAKIETVLNYVNKNLILFCYKNI